MDASLLDEEHSFTFSTKAKGSKERVFDLDVRLLKAVARLGFKYPTIVQSRCIPLALEGKDLLVRARTGSGKTLAYALPLVQKILLSKKQRSAQEAGAASTKALVLVPSKELISQAQQQLLEVLVYCRDVVSLTALKEEGLDIQKAWVERRHDVVICTPGRLVKVLSRVSEGCKERLRQSVETLVIDEADLIFSYGYADDVKTIMSYLPKTYQAFLMSATLSTDVSALRSMVLHNPAIVKLEEGETDGKLAQWYVAVGADDKDLLLFALLRLKLVQGKTLFFVNSVERCYRFKLLLEQFHVRAAVLNAELPMNSRQHILDEFNKGLFDNLIATDDSITHKDVVDVSKKRSAEADGKKDFGVARGVDFRDVKTVVNIDLPLTNESYTHRVGRTARGGANGTALSFVNSQDAAEMKRLGEIQSEQPGRMIQNAEGTLERQQQPAKLALELSEIETFRYRVEDVRRAVTRRAIRDARLKEIKQEMLNSEKLRAHFEDNPTDLDLLEHDKHLRPSKVQKSLASIPSYLMPRLGAEQELELVGKGASDSLGKSKAGRVRWKERHKKGKFSTKRRKRRKKDPLF